VSAPTLQDVHLTATTTATPMAGPEIQANAIWSALHGNPLRSTPSWLALLAILLCAVCAPLASVRFRVLISALIAVCVAGVYLLVAQIAFKSGTVLVLSYPLAAWAIGTAGMVTANYAAALVLIQRLAQAVESRDVETGEHIHRIGLLCERLALAVGWSSRDAEMIRHASVMHDIGKIAIPDRVLLKPGALDGEEWEVVKAHTTLGARILAESESPLVQMAESIARCHHEHWDGTGYPAGLKGDEIPLAARICTVVDVYDALLSTRSYKHAWPVADVLAEIARGSATHFDPALVRVFLRIAPELTPQLDASLARERAPLSPARVAPA